MGKRLLVLIISFLLISQQVISSSSSNNESSNRKEKQRRSSSNSFNEDVKEGEDSPVIVFDDENYEVDSTSMSGFKRKRGDSSPFQDFDCEQKKKKEHYLDDESSFDLSYFEEELFRYSHSSSNFSFKTFFNGFVSDNPDFIDTLVQSVLRFGDIDMILALYQEGYIVVFPNERLKKDVLQKAFQARNVELIEYLLEEVEDPIAYSLDLSPCDEIIEILESLRKPKKKAPADEFIKRVTDFRRNSLQFYSKNSYSFHVLTDRTRVFESIYEVVKRHGDCWYSGAIRLFIEFEGEIGVDQGGLTNEFIELLIENFNNFDSRRILSADFYNRLGHSSSSKTQIFDGVFDFTEAFFIETTSEIRVPNTNYSPKLFKLIGSIFALAFNLDIPLGIELLPVFYRMILTDESLSTFASIEDELKYVDSELYSGLVALRKTDLEGLKLDFNGNEVTRANLEEFIYNEAYFHTFLKYKEHLDNLKEGFFSLINSEEFGALRLRPGELRDIMRGESILTAEDFIKHVNVSRLTDLDSRKWIFSIIEEFSDQERLLLFKFITARRSVPLKGLKNLMNPISFASINLQNPIHLPTASTCASLMKIPVYKSKTILKEKLLLAISSCETFDLE